MLSVTSLTPDAVKWQKAMSGHNGQTVAVVVERAVFFKGDVSEGPCDAREFRCGALTFLAGSLLMATDCPEPALVHIAGNLDEESWSPRARSFAMARSTPQPLASPPRPSAIPFRAVQRGLRGVICTLRASINSHLDTSVAGGGACRTW
jgi:hypothetical protein